MSKTNCLNDQSGIYPNYTDIFKASELRDAQFSSPYNFPIFKRENIVPRKLIPFDKIFKAVQGKIKMQKKGN